MKVVGNRTMATLLVTLLVEGLSVTGILPPGTAEPLKAALLTLAGVFFASKVQALVESSGEPR